MQEGATPHIGRHAKELLRDHLKNEHFISKSFLNDLLHRSRDLNPCHTWLWGFVDDCICKRNILT